MNISIGNEVLKIVELLLAHEDAVLIILTLSITVIVCQYIRRKKKKDV